MKYLLDANAIIALTAQHPRLLARMRHHSPQDFAVSAIVFHELFFGAFKSARQAQNLRQLAAFRLEVVPFDGGDARHAGEIRATLVLGGTPIGPYDVLIAGQAVARNLVLITRNTREFQRVGGLMVEDWES